MTRFIVKKYSKSKKYKETMEFIGRSTRKVHSRKVVES